MADATTPDSNQADAGRPSRKHRALVAILIVVGSLLLFVSIFAIWAKTTLLDTDGWTETSAQLLENEEIREALGPYLTDQIFSSVDVTAEFESALPQNLQALAAPAAAGLQQLAERRSVVFLARPRVQEAWRFANQAAHEQFVKLVEDKGQFVSSTGGVVTLDLGTVVDQIAQETGVGSRIAERIPEGAGQIVILKSDRLEQVQSAVHVLDILGTWLWVIALAVFVLAGFLARGFRRQALRGTAYGFLVVGLLLLIVLRIGQNRLIDALILNPEYRPAGKAAWAIVVSALRDTGRTVTGIGVIGVLAAWVAGPGRHAVALRRWLSPFMRDHVALVWGAFALVFLLIFLWGPTRATGSLGTLVLLVFAALGLEALRRQIVREFPAGSTGVGTELSEPAVAVAASAAAPVPGESKRDSGPERPDG